MAKLTLDPVRRCFRWLRDTLDMICDRPDHMQRLSVVGFGLGSGMFVGTFTYLLVRYGDRTDELASQVVPILGNALYGSLGLMALGAVVLLGLIKGIGGFQIQTPGGISIGIQTTSSDVPHGGAFDLPPIEVTNTINPTPRAPDNKGANMEGA